MSKHLSTVQYSHRVLTRQACGDETSFQSAAKVSEAEAHVWLRSKRCGRFIHPCYTTYRVQCSTKTDLTLLYLPHDKTYARRTNTP